jgi:hypothetical protein
MWPEQEVCSAQTGDNARGGLGGGGAAQGQRGCNIACPGRNTDACALDSSEESVLTAWS